MIFYNLILAYTHVQTSDQTISKIWGFDDNTNFLVSIHALARRATIDLAPRQSSASGFNPRAREERDWSLLTLCFQVRKPQLSADQKAITRISEGFQTVAIKLLKNKCLQIANRPGFLESDELAIKGLEHLSEGPLQLLYHSVEAFDDRFYQESRIADYPFQGRISRGEHLEV